jgi:hypothetical protein
MFYNYILFKVFIKKCSFRRFFIQNVRASTCCGGVFVFSDWLEVIDDSQVTNRSAEGEGGSHRESSLHPIGRLGVTNDSHPHVYALFFIAIRTRVLKPKVTTIHHIIYSQESLLIVRVHMRTLK